MNRRKLKLLKYYIELELVRFENKFTVVYNINPRINLESIEIPSLLIQPFVENAIIHRLNNKKNGKALLTISITKKERKLLFIIEDNRIGRVAAAKLKDKALTQHPSMGIMITKERLARYDGAGNRVEKQGIMITKERLALINQGKDILVEVEDLSEEEQSIGTRMKIYA